MRIALFVILAALALASCTSPADRITEALLKHGVHQRQAKCMGARLADRLDSAQLQRLSELSKLDNPDRVDKLTLDQFLDQLNRSGDPKLVSQVVRAGLSCAI